MNRSTGVCNVISVNQLDQHKLTVFKTSALTSAVSVLFGLSIFSSVFAQNAPAVQQQKTEVVVITGTLIRGVTPTGSPVVGFGAKEIQEGGFFNATEVLRSLPQILNLGATDSQTITTASSGATNQTGANGINLRGLGTPSTLTLVNGHRSAPSGTNGQLFDASTIPSLAIGRMEVLVDGTSALYGSDAVAGVVNIRLKSGFDGASTQVSGGGGHGVRQWSASQLFGKVWDTGSLTATVEHTYRNNVEATERPEFYNSNPYDYGITPVAGSGIFQGNPANIRVTAGTFSGIGCTAAAPCFFAVPTNQNGSNLTGAALPTTPGAVANRYVGVNLRNLYKDFTLLPEQKRNTLVLVLEQELGERVKLSGEVLSTKRDFTRYAPQVATNLNIPNANPYSPCNLSKSNRPTYCGPLATSVLVVPYFFGQELGPNITKGYSKNTTASGTVEVDLGHEWRGELSGTYSKNQDDRLVLNTTNTYAPNPDNYNYNNPANLSSFLNNFNPFIGDGSTSANNLALADKFRAFNDVNVTYVLKNVAARFDGPLFTLPGGDIKMAAGVEHRTDDFTRTQTGTQLSGLGTVNAQGFLSGLSTSGKDVQTINPPAKDRTIKSAYTEFFIPLVGKNNAMPFVQKLDLSLAGRYEHNNLYGSSRTPKIGVTWAVNSDFQLNGTYGRSFRAPALPEADTFQATATCFSGLSQFCPNFLNFNGQSLTGTQRVLMVGGGNPDLKPETARTKTLGFSFHPRAVPGLDVTVGYYDIKYTNRITGTQVFGTNTDVLTNPIYTSLILAGSASQAPTAAQINQWLAYINANTIGPNGGYAPATDTIVAIVDARLQNSGILTTNGFDLSARYAWDSAIGRWNAGFSATLVNSWKVAVTPSSALTEVINTNRDAYPLRFRARGQLGWRSGPYALTGTANYTNSYTNTNAVGTGAGLLPANESVASYTTLDLNTSYDFGKTGQGLLKNLRVQLNVQNLFDRDPPYVRFLTGNYVAFDPQNAGAIGRQISLQVSKDWQ